MGTKLAMHHGGWIEAKARRKDDEVLQPADGVEGSGLAGRRLTFETTDILSTPAQAPPKKALLSREQFEGEGLDNRDGQVPDGEESVSREDWLMDM